MSPTMVLFLGRPAEDSTSGSRDMRRCFVAAFSRWPPCSLTKRAPLSASLTSQNSVGSIFVWPLRTSKVSAFSPLLQRHQPKKRPSFLRVSMPQAVYHRCGTDSSNFASATVPGGMPSSHSPSGARFVGCIVCIMLNALCSLINEAEIPLDPAYLSHCFASGLLNMSGCREVVPYPETNVLFRCHRCNLGAIDVVVEALEM